MRTRYIQRSDGKLIPADQWYQAEVSAPFIMDDIQPYRSMADGSIITSRSHHRAHLKQHGCEEIGNETAHIMQRPAIPDDGSRKALIIAQVQELGHDGLRRALKRDIDNARWNSRKD